MDPGAVEARIEAAIPDAEATVTYPRPNDTDHLAATVVSPAFADRPLVEQHELVYDALDELMTTEIHALKVTTRTPEASTESEHGAADATRSERNHDLR